MKKFTFAIVGMMLMIVSTVLLGCNGGGTISSVKLKGVKETYYTGDTVDLSAINLEVTYEGNSKKTLTKAEFDVDLENVKEDTEFVVDTDGLFSTTNTSILTAGTYDITVQVVGDKNKKVYDAMTVTVTENTFTMISFDVPKNVADYDNKVTSETEESSFYVKEKYYVGSDNPYIFKPHVAFEADHGDLAENGYIATEDEVPFNVNLKIFKVQLGDDGSVSSEAELTGEEIANYYSFDNATFGIQFTTAAEGQSFRIEMTPKDFETNISGDAFAPATQIVTVTEGWNAYSAEDLARINIVSEGLETTAYHRNRTEASIFWNKDTKSYEQGDLVKIWKEHAGEAWDNATPIKGIFMHNDIAVTEKDLPEQFLLTEEEVNAVTNTEVPKETLVGSVRDWTFLYSHLVEEDGDGFTFNGNMFKLDFSDLKLCYSFVGGGSGSLKVYASSKECQPGHSAVFAFTGREDGTSNSNIVFKNVDAVGNAGDTFSGAGVVNYSTGAEILLKEHHCKVNVDNCIAKNFQISWFTENGRNRDNYQLNINHAKTYNGFNSAIYAYSSDHITVSKSEFKRFGGPAILLTSFTSKSDGVETGHGASCVKVDKETVIESLIAGDEAWFSLLGATEIATNLKALNQLFLLQNTKASLLTNVKSSEDAEPVAKFNLKALVIDEYNITSDNMPIYGSYEREGNIFNLNTFDKARPNGLPIAMFDVMETIYNMKGQYPPVFLPSGDAEHTASQMMIYDGETYLYQADSTNLVNALSNQSLPAVNEELYGDEINILYPINGKTMIGVVLEMYHPAA